MIHLDLPFVKRITKSMIVLDVIVLGIYLSMKMMSINIGLQVILSTLLLQGITWCGITDYFNCYSNLFFKESTVVFSDTFKVFIYYSVCSCCVCLCTLFNVLLPREIVWFIFNYLLFFISYIILSRLCFFSIRKYCREKGGIVQNFVFIGGSDSLQEVMRQMSEDRYLGCHCVGYYHTHQLDYLPLTYLGDYKQLEAAGDAHAQSEAVISLSALGVDEVKRFCERAENFLIRTRFLPEFLSVGKSVVVHNIGSFPVLSVRNEPLEKEGSSLVKDIFDFAFSFLVCVLVLSWLIPIIGLLIKLESRGPVFFVQDRSGRGGTVFKCFKFRTMRVNAAADSVQATRGDARITKVGAFLRKTSLDELPQFINVLKGNMSIVGPRPHMLSHTKKFAEVISTFMVRHYIKPGITGLAQVSGFRGETNELWQLEKRVEHDITYVENWNILLDLKIIFLTVWNMVRGEKNAY